MSKRPFVSLVLATVGRTEELGRCLRSLAAQTDQAFEVLVVDQNADSRLDQWIEESRRMGLNVRQLRLDKPNLSGARNLGIAESCGDIIGFPDDDCWYEPDVIAILRDNFLQDSRIDGLVACWVEQSASRRVAQHIGQLSLKSWRNFRDGDASSISLFFRRSVFQQLRGFDERLGLGNWFGSAEETELMLRILESGHVVLRCPAARVHHAFGEKGKGNLQVKWQYARNCARGTGAIYAKHRLGYWVILRGMVAPLIKPIWTMQGFESIALGQATFVGRLEGMLRWHRRNM